MRVSRLFSAWLVVLPLVCAAALGQGVGEVPEKAAPFDAIEFEEDALPRIRVDGVWYRWHAIDGVGVEELAEFVRSHRRDPGKRLSEDLVEWMGRFGHPVGAAVTLTVSADEGGEVFELPGVVMTGANRDAVWVYRNYAWPDEVDSAGVFDEVVALIEGRHAYARLRGLDVRAEAEGVLEGLGESPSVHEVALGVQRLVLKLGDGHAMLDRWWECVPEGWLPFRLESCEGGVVVRQGDRSGFVDGARPFVVSIDGVAFEEWVRVAQQYVVDGSAAVELRRGLRQAEAVNLVRERLGVPPSGRAVVGFAREGAADVVLREFELGREATRSAQVERAAEELEDGVLYLRLETMALEDKDLEWLSDQLDRAAGLRGLLIDVRGNGGGSRDATRAVLERLVHRVEGGARVVNAARPRAWDERTGAPDSLSNRYLWPADWEGWSDRERAAIERFGKEFEPSWAPGDGFGSWRYFVVSEPVEGVKRVEGPVVVLMDAGCFSATDIFLGALKGVPGVTLVGSASSGGSARSRGHRVEGLNTELRLASMVSYQPSGLLYDGVGIEPDVVVRPTAACLIGRSDVQFERAVEILHDQLRED